MNLTPEQQLDFYRGALTEAGYPNAPLVLVDLGRGLWSAYIHLSCSEEELRAYHKAVLLLYPNTQRCFECWVYFMKCDVHK
jgi:hypothetical protein